MEAETGEAEATGTVDLANRNGGYFTDPDGTILQAPPSDSFAYEFFTFQAGPIGVPPMVGDKKVIPEEVTFTIPYHLVNAPYGALVAGFSLGPNPISLADILDGFSLIGGMGTAVAPASGGYLILAVNDLGTPPTIDDNSGVYEARVSRAQAVPEPSSLILWGLGAVGFIAVRKAFHGQLLRHPA